MNNNDKLNKGKLLTVGNLFRSSFDSNSPLEF